MSTLLIFIGVLAVLVLAHEFGHFSLARKFGVKVNEFGVGFPPRLFGWRRGETLYTINLIPLGGFVKIKGESGEFAEDQDSFAHKPVWQRSLILVGGVSMNFILATVLLSVGLMFGLPQVTENLPANAKVKDHKVQIMSVLTNSPAAEASLQLGDEIYQINNESITNVSQVQEIIGASQGEEITINTRRGQEERDVVVSPIILNETNGYGIGVALVSTGIVSYPWYSAFYRGAVDTGLMTKEIVVAFYQLLNNLITKQSLGMDISGPVGIAVITGQVAKLGFVYLLQFAALLSINLAVINVLPFPALDGGRLVFVLAEKLRRGKSISRKLEAIVHNIGFLFLIGLVIAVTYRDIVRYGGQIFGAIFNS